MTTFPSARVPVSPSAPAGSAPLDELRLNFPDLYEILLNSPAHAYARMEDVKSSKQGFKQPWRAGWPNQGGHKRPPLPPSLVTLGWDTSFVDVFAIDDMASYGFSGTDPKPTWQMPGRIVPSGGAPSAVVIPLDSVSSTHRRVTVEGQVTDDPWSADLVLARDDVGWLQFATINNNGITYNFIDYSAGPFATTIPFPIAAGHYWIRAAADYGTGLLHVDIFDKPIHEAGPMLHSACLAPGWSPPDLNAVISKTKPALGITGAITLNELSVEDGVPA